jgi:hypothetical protein
MGNCEASKSPQHAGRRSATDSGKQRGVRQAGCTAPNTSTPLHSPMLSFPIPSINRTRVPRPTARAAGSSTGTFAVGAFCRLMPLSTFRRTCVVGEQSPRRTNVPLLVALRTNLACSIAGSTTLPLAVAAVLCGTGTRHTSPGSHPCLP